MMFACLAILCYIDFNALNPQSIKANKIHSAADVSFEATFHNAIGGDGAGISFEESFHNSIDG